MELGCCFLEVALLVLPAGGLPQSFRVVLGGTCCCIVSCSGRMCMWILVEVTGGAVPGLAFLCRLGPPCGGFSWTSHTSFWALLCVLQQITEQLSAIGCNRCRDAALEAWREVLAEASASGNVEVRRAAGWRVGVGELGRPVRRSANKGTVRGGFPTADRCAKIFQLLVVVVARLERHAG